MGDLDIELIRKKAALEVGRRELESVVEVDPLVAFQFQKAAAAEDPGLMALAASLPGDTLEVYEAMGGKYKAAFGQPMFQAQAAPPPTGMPTVGAPAGGAGAGPKPLKPPSIGGQGAGGTTTIKEPKIPGQNGLASGGSSVG